jgi:lysozyme
MFSRRGVLGGLAGLTMPALAGCGGRPAPSQARVPPINTPAYNVPAPVPASTTSWQPSVAGLDAVIDISHNVRVSDFSAVRRSNILAVIHKTTEGGDWFDPSYAARKAEAEHAGLLWGGYHFGTRQYPGARQAQTFLSAVQPGPKTLLALDLEPNDQNPGNTMRVAQAEEFVRVVQQQTGRLPMLYTHAAWADGDRFGRRGIRLDRPIGPDSILARCDLWLGDPADEPRVPYAWQARGWKLWQYVANESENDTAYGAAPRAIPGITHCDRNLFNGDAQSLYRYWGATVGRTGV